jgi:hypothetical protein
MTEAIIILALAVFAVGLYFVALRGNGHQADPEAARRYVYRLTVQWPDKPRTYDSYVKREMVRLAARYAKDGHASTLRRETWVGRRMVSSEVVDG